MIVGFCGSGNMAAAMARGWAGEFESMLFSDNGSGKAQALASELGGEAVGNAALAERSDFVVLAVKPAGLEGVAPDLAAAARVVSILGATSLERLRSALPGAEILRVMPNVGVEVRQGVLCLAGDAGAEAREKLRLLGHVVEIADGEFDEATAIMGCAPAYLALVVEALADAGTAAGLDAALARELVVETAAGTAELLRTRDAAEVREAVTSPGGSTEAGLEALDREGAREAFAAAVAASLERMRG
ncbi:MAG TPA: pyrroline-5-carboxylate reductase dimerization domain-containing protein [Solirubrobacterales bacterium]|jgi:pyrroline-5-carboxylate reductase|nr:pyrroline-5-carboxylate reductase dimerization domain-containing protein [Solirubrobacterales bacterium]